MNITVKRYNSIVNDVHYVNAIMQLENAYRLSYLSTTRTDTIRIKCVTPIFFLFSDKKKEFYSFFRNT